MSYTQIEKDSGVAIIWMDQPGEKINKLAPELVDEFHALIDDLEKDDSVRAAVLISRKKDNFIAGADLDKLMALHEPGAVEALSRSGQKLLDRLAGLSKPVVAAINGAALGGGLEVALACHYRIATDDPKTVLGQPEVQLGLLPAAGGTQRLPRLISLQKALDMVLTGRNIYPRPAKRMGLVDDVVNPYALLAAARQAALRLAHRPLQRKKKLKLIDKLLESTSFTRRIVYKQAKKSVLAKTLGNYPAPLKILSCVQTGMEKGYTAGLAAEARGFEELARTPQCRELVHLFFGMTAAKKNPRSEQVRDIGLTAVLGAGLMGAGIANVSAQKGMNTILKDISMENIGRGQKTVYDDLQRKVRRRAMTGFQRDEIMSRINPAIDYSGFGKVDLVIEAVFEDLDLKHRILAETEAATRDDCIFASNTSSLPISLIAEKARRPQNIIGMHYFSPVPRMPLLEIIVTEKTAEWVTATAMEIGLRQGKTVIVVNDGPGFYTSRILAPMLNEALMLLEEGGEIRQLDRVMKKFGFPVGPVTLIDEVGIDVGAHVSEVLGAMFSHRGVQPSSAMEKMAADGFKGRKNKQGFYHYNDAKGGLLKFGRKKKEVNHNIYKFFGGADRKELPVEDIQTRLSLAMVNEAIFCLQENILHTPRDGDLGAILGLGFPPFLGGPFRYVDSLTPAAVLSSLDALAERHGARFAAAQLLRDMVKQGKTFYG